MALDTLGDARRLREDGVDERMASFERRLDARFDALRADMHRALAIQGGVILGGVGVIVALVESL
ncbi:MAG: hypothetical protein OXI51_14260 [Chloroflexota bacterium]|nr:hypothetical protein [Chloroflexota bacterium]